MDNAKQYNIKDENGDLVDYGVFVTEVLSDTAAERAGLKARDVILRVNNFEPSEYDSFPGIMSTFYPNDTVTLTVLRKGKRIEIKATLGARP